VTARAVRYYLERLAPAPTEPPPVEQAGPKVETIKVDAVRIDDEAAARARAAGEAPEAPEATPPGSLPAANPPLDGKGLIALADSITMVVTLGLAAAYKVPLPADVGIDKGTRDSLTPWAEGAARKFGPYIGNTDTVAAILFVGLWSVGIAKRVKVMKPLPPDTRPAPKPGAAPSSSSPRPSIAVPPGRTGPGS
jgi:hypothetical protein